MRIIQYRQTGEGEIRFSWKEILTLIIHRRLKLNHQTMKIFSGALLKIIMEWEANFNNPNIEQVEEKDVLGPNKEK